MTILKPKAKEDYNKLEQVCDKLLKKVCLPLLGLLLVIGIVGSGMESKNELQHQFSPYDGSHYQLERYLKKYLKDPSSYEHIETRYIDKKDYLIVMTQYRAKNGFGGMDIGNIVAKVSLDGDILKVISSN